ncbi:hypothetical protein NDU88_003578 [Pleurodeles waltl]|uniref:Uncharacterized protein n=1 Tax=Pleurodeles waltl TaxID=8319 RepID=A0AAV7SGB3_PLEWA|nr:hypothetical protein NDU88_003578 [Pleurodeles waltl]
MSNIEVDYPETKVGLTHYRGIQREAMDPQHWENGAHRDMLLSSSTCRLPLGQDDVLTSLRPSVMVYTHTRLTTHAQAYIMAQQLFSFIYSSVAMDFLLEQQ